MSRKNSAFLQQMNELRIASQNATKETYTQYLTDTLVLTLNDYGWGEQRIRKLLADWGKVYDEYFDALRKEPETDYYRSKMDERIKDICKSGDWIPFEDRYRYLPEMKY